MRYEDKPMLGTNAVEFIQWTDPLPFAKRLPKQCPCNRKYLSDLWHGEALNYHIMTCRNCGTSTIWPVSKTGLVFIGKNSKFFDLTVKLYKESKTNE